VPYNRQFMVRTYRHTEATMRISLKRVNLISIVDV